MRLEDLVAKYLGKINGKQEQIATDNSNGSVAPKGDYSNTDLGHDIDVLSPSVDDWPPEWLEVFEERAAIMEFDGHIPRPEAERAAQADIRQVFCLQQEAKRSQETNVKGDAQE